MSDDGAATPTATASDRYAFFIAVGFVVLVLLVPVVAWLGLMVRLFLYVSGLGG